MIQWLIKIFVVLATTLMIAVNALANILPINGKTTGEVSDAFPSLFTPAGYVFSIWSLIYIGLLVFTFYQLGTLDYDEQEQDKIRGWYIFSSLMNGLWILLWHYEQYFFTVVVMLLLLVSLIRIYRIINQRQKVLTLKQKFCLRVPFSLYLGWISVATVANISVYLLSIQWGGWGVSPVVWTLLALVTAAFLGLLSLLRDNDYVFNAVLVWALFGIYVRQSDTPLVAYTALVLSLVCFVHILLALTRGFFQRKKWGGDWFMRTGG